MFEEIVESHLATFAAVESLAKAVPVDVRIDAFWGEVADRTE